MALGLPLLTSLVAVPLGGAVLLLLLGKGRDGLVRQAALAISLVTLAISLAVWWQFNAQSADYQFVERHAWLPDFGISYHVGIDGITLMLVVLTTFLTPILVLVESTTSGSASSCRAQPHDRRLRLLDPFLFSCCDIPIS